MAYRSNMVLIVTTGFRPLAPGDQPFAIRSGLVKELAEGPIVRQVRVIRRPVLATPRSASAAL